MNRTQLVLLASSLAAGALTLLPSPAHAAACIVDQTGLFPSAYPDIASALSVCDGTTGMDEILFYCEQAHNTCEIEGFSLVSQQIVFKVIGGSDRPVFYTGISAEDSELHVLGAMKISTPFDPAVEALSSVVTLRGDGDYITLAAGGAPALRVVGASSVELERVQLRDSFIGLQTEPYLGDAPVIEAREVSFSHNQTAGVIDSFATTCGAPPSPTHTQLDLLLGQGNQPNYVEGNGAGFVLRGDARMTAEHTIFLRNLGWGLTHPSLVEVGDAADFRGVNLLGYDNDDIADLGLPLSSWLTVPVASVVRTTDCATVDIDASTFAHNRIEYGLSTGSSEPMYVHATVLEETGRKGLNGSSGILFTDGTTTIHGSQSNWDGCEVNYYGPPVATCPPMAGTVSDDPMLDASTAPSWSPYPLVMEDLFLVGNPREVGPVLADDLLDPATAWSTDGVTRDTGLVDWGYHNPCSGC
ncbi:MAG: hypothetical protein AB1Z98_27465 [Nannocystaceae bacterium]